MRAHMTDADKGVLEYASCPIGLALPAPIVLRMLRTHWASCVAIPYKLQEGSQA
jgi:hypothetical protein